MFESIAWRPFLQQYHLSNSAVSISNRNGTLTISSTLYPAVIRARRGKRCVGHPAVTGLSSVTLQRHHSFATSLREILSASTTHFRETTEPPPGCEDSC